jgi:hypothetical protein
MPIFSYFAVMGAVLAALLFVADAKLEKRGPLPFNNEFAGLPKAWHPEGAPSGPRGSTLVATPAPAPDMLSEAVKVAMPTPGPHIGEPQAAAKAETSGAAVADAAPAPKPVKRVARKQPRWNDDRQNYAWSRNGDFSPFGGGPTFGRF